MYRHVLIPTDGSELAGRAVRHGLSLAKFVGAKVTALTVEASFDVYTVPASRVYAMSGAFAEHAERAKAHAERFWTASLNKLAQLGSSATRCKSKKTILTKPSSRPPSKGVATSSLWPRTDAPALRRSCSAA
jgi:Universal stress protein family